MSSNKVIALDVDDVLLDFLSHSHLVAEKIKQDKINPVIQDWSMNTRYGLTHEQEALMWQNIEWDNLPIKQYAQELMEELLRKKWTIHYVTAIDAENKEKRISNLKKVFGNKLFNLKNGKQFLHCVGKEKSKLNTMKAINPLIMVDDRLKNLAEVHTTISQLIVYLDTGVREKCHHVNMDVLSSSQKQLKIVGCNNEVLNIVQNFQ